MNDILGGSQVLGLLSPELQAQAEQRARSAGLTNLGFALLQASQGQPGQRRPGLGQIIGQAGPVGLQAYQQSFDRTLQDMLRAQQIQDMQRQRAQREQQELARQRFAQQFAPVTPQTALQAPGQVGPTPARAAMIGQTPALDRSQLLSAILDPNIPADVAERAKTVFEATKPVETKAAPGDVGAYEAALQRGFIQPGTTYEQFVAMRKPAPATTSVTNIVGGEKLSPGEIEQDKDFGKEIGQWKRGGGQDMAAQIAQLKPVIESLESGEPITGVSVAIQPDILLAMTNPKALQSRELVEEVVQRNLRTILGAQFTAQEGERLIARAFNPKLPPEENAKRVRRLFLQMSSAAEQKQAMADYFDQFGTLRGYKGKMPSVDDFYRAMEGDAGTMQIPAGGNLMDAARRELERRGVK